METGTALARRGLTSAEAAGRLTADGPNAVAVAARRRLLSRVGRQLADQLVALLLAAAVVTALLDDLPDTAVILLVVVVNTVIGVAQEVRADRAIAALDQLAAFVVLGLAQLGVALAVRAVPEPGTPRNWALLGAVALSAVLQVTAVLTGPLQTLLGAQPLTMTELLACGAVAVIPGAALWLTTYARNRKEATS